MACGSGAIGDNLNAKNGVAPHTVLYRQNSDCFPSRPWIQKKKKFGGTASRSDHLARLCRACSDSQINPNDLNPLTGHLDLIKIELLAYLTTSTFRRRHFQLRAKLSFAFSPSRLITSSAGAFDSASLASPKSSARISIYLRRLNTAKTESRLHLRNGRPRSVRPDCPIQFG